MDWTVPNFYGLSIGWRYDANYTNISMPSFIRNVLILFQYPHPCSPQILPHAHTSIQYGSKERQYALKLDSSPLLLDKLGTNYIQQVVGLLLYYTRAIDSTILVALHTIGSE